MVVFINHFPIENLIQFFVITLPSKAGYFHKLNIRLVNNKLLSGSFEIRACHVVCEFV